MMHALNLGNLFLFLNVNFTNQCHFFKSARGFTRKYCKFYLGVFFLSQLLSKTLLLYSIIVLIV